MLRVERKHISFSSESNSNGNYLYHGELFEGIAYSTGPDGQIISEEEYRQGLRWGCTREWSRSGVLYFEAMFYRDVVHGSQRQWYENGQLQEESECEYGIVKRETNWDADGNIIHHYELQENDPNYSLLVTLRAIYEPLNDVGESIA